MEDVVERALEGIGNTSTSRDQDRLITLNSASWTLYVLFYIISNNFSPVAVSTSQRFISMLTDKIAMASHRQVILKKYSLTSLQRISGDAGKSSLITKLR